MIGKFIVYEGVFKDRFVARKVVGETGKFWITEAYSRDPGEPPEKRHKKKASMDIISVHDDFAFAQRAAKRLIEAFKIMNDRHQRERKATIDGARTPAPAQ